ncbi:hypothetical protein V6N12_057686 [Hibiscus sabdariffa]|uniref:Uncharacterized protein n=1 Tax=Hibiscus sabdariffa TaxID=183260 RepID=A0ABR2C5V9_9ROSI
MCNNPQGTPVRLLTTLGAPKRSLLTGLQTVRPQPFTLLRTRIRRVKGWGRTVCRSVKRLRLGAPQGKTFSFGHPSIESMANRFLNNNIFPPNGNPHPLGELEVQMKNQLATDSTEGWPNENGFPAGEKQIKRTSVPQSVVISLFFLYISDLRFENLSSSFSIAFISIFCQPPVFFPGLSIVIKDMRTKETIKRIKKE